MSNKNRNDTNGRFVPLHGQRHTKLYGIWCAMKRRCYNVNDKRYSRYGGRGIIVCDSWLNFEPFYNWSLANGYKEGLSIDRISNNGNYEPSNCRWVTKKEQNRNYSRNHTFVIEGEEMCIIEIAEKYNIPYARLMARIKRGMNIEKAICSKDMRYK